MKLFETYQMKNMTLRNRIVMPPMCMYQATSDGFPTLFHLCHYATRAMGGAGLIIVESTAVTPEGRISDNDLGLWNDDQIAGMKRVADVIHANGAKAALQLNHAGRKSRSASGGPFAPSAIPFDENSRVPGELTERRILALTEAFRQAAQRADQAGFDALEIHAAHGYLLHEFLSPLTNRRTDGYGGTLENRVRFLHEVLTAAREVWPADKPLWLRVSACDYQECGIDGGMMSEMIRQIKPLVDCVHVSSGGLLPVKVSDYPGYQVQFAEELRRECGIPTIAVGLITDEKMAEEILENGRADLIALGRELLRNPYWPINVAAKYGLDDFIPESYRRAYVKP